MNETPKETIRRDRRGTQGQKRRQKQLRRRLYMSGTAIFVLCLLLIGGQTFVTVAGNNRLAAAFLNIGKGNEKKSEEHVVNKNEVCFDINTRWSCEGNVKKVPLHLNNPSYSAYPIRVEVYEEGKPEEILYQSEVLMPGEKVDEASFSKEYTSGTYQMCIRYFFYKEGSQEEVFGTHEVGAVLKIYQSH